MSGLPPWRTFRYGAHRTVFAPIASRLACASLRRARLQPIEAGGGREVSASIDVTLLLLRSSVQTITFDGDDWLERSA
jgi:hypothetical protein